MRELGMNNQDSRFEGPIAIVDRGDEAGPVSHARDAFVDALKEVVEIEHADHWTESDSDSVIVVGQTDDPVVQKLLGDVERTPESVVIDWAETDEGDALVISGSDDRGVTYALYELADEIRAGEIAALTDVERSVETPDNEVRGIDRFIMGPVSDGWLYNEAFWHYYLQRLARNRFNRLVLVAGYDSAFMSPPYPFFVDVPGYPDVKVPDDQVDISREEHRELINTIGQLCDSYGLEFYFGIWQQRPDWKDDQGKLVQGLPDDPNEFADYCTTGLTEFLLAFPEVDGLQLRVNWESGVSVDDLEHYEKDRSATTAEAFWRDIITAVETAADERERDLKLDLRAKGLTDRMIQWAQETGLDVTVPTKFWCESTGLPHHNTQMRSGELANVDDPNKGRRYGHADLLRKPRFYDVLYRLWVSGTNRVFLWGDPDYARRFSHATQFGGATGFEVTAPLSLKGGHFYLQDEEWPIFEDESLRDYEWEDERYWAWYVLFGRLGYSTDTDSAVWEREFERRFEEAAGDITRAYRSASKVLPLLTAAHLTHHPALANWAELDTGGALFADHNLNPRIKDAGVTYGTAEPSDPGLFYGIDEYVRDRLDDEHDGRYTPLQVRDWYQRLATETREAANSAKASVDDPTGELAATLLDMQMLADLADYHAKKTEAAIALEFHEETADSEYLLASHDAMANARDDWQSLADRGEGTYHDDLVFGMGPSSAHEGKWADRLPEMDADIEELERRIDELESAPVNKTVSPSVLDRADRPDFSPPSFRTAFPDTTPAGEAVRISLKTGELNDHDEVTLHYRHTNMNEGPFKRKPMNRTDTGYQATIPEEYVTAEWDLQIYISTTDVSGDGLIIPGLYNADQPFPYYIIEVETK